MKYASPLHYDVAIETSVRRTWLLGHRDLLKNIARRSAPRFSAFWKISLGRKFPAFRLNTTAA